MENSNVLMVQYFMFLSLTSLLALNFVRVAGSLTIPLIFSNSPQSHLYIKNLTRQQRIEQLVRQTLDRAHYISSSRRTINSSQPERIPQQELCIQYSIVLLKIRVGTFETPIPYKTYYMHVDTGSDQIWLQCEDCLIPPNKCFGNPPIFFPDSESSTYHLIPCGSHEFCYIEDCKNDVCTYECQQGYCSYHISYLDSSGVMGFLAFEKFAFDTSSRQNDVTQDTVFNLIFGCNVFYEGVPIITSETGILCLGWGPRSFISQIKTQVDDVFSYCFPLFEETFSGAQGYLNFGLGDNFDPRYFSTTTLTRYVDNVSYYLKLHGISVLGRKLEIDPSKFIKRGNSGGTIIDSGAAVSLIIQQAYEELKVALIAYFESHGNYQRVNPGSFGSGLDLCFKSVGRYTKEFPSVTLHFEGANLVLKPANVFTRIKNPRDPFCLTILPTNLEENILGAYQQSNIHFIYDRKKFLLHFREENCRLGA